ncbi:pre-piRNA 3'-exonuclease trimmer [Procambarus clarkii]|uniref:pre-piRNA 3'-exonuclease trimmer n=1 Tax=Procambarus clarkii TaxID=6728 RepID=UPI00374459D8
MVEVTTNNFNQLLPGILSDIKSSSFVALDTEFTGLLADAAFKGSLFDDGPKRYQKLVSNIRRFTICQLGLAIFKGVPDANAYTVTSYNFYLRPHSCISFDPTFLCQTSSIEFLQKYKFDFNKWLYSGIGCMNSDEMEQLRSELFSLVRGSQAFRIPYSVQDQLSIIGEWGAKANEGETTIPSDDIDVTSQVILVVSIRSRFPDLWAALDNRQVIIQKVSALERARLEAQDPEGKEFVETVVRSMLGFTSVFRCLADHQKPLVLHNCLLDLMLIYKQLHQNLPTSYDMFKSNLHKMFPIIYDTKFIASELKILYREKDEKVRNLINNTGLVELHSSLKREMPVLYQPSLKHCPPDNKYSGNETLPHEAGYDAFLTGGCFLTMAHVHAMLQMSSLSQQRPMSPREHVYALKSLANCVQIQRAAIPYMELAGQDPKSKRPPWLLVEGRTRSALVTPGSVSIALAQYGHLDVVPRNANSVLVATSSWLCTRDIFTNLAKDSHLKVKFYNRLRHSPFVRTLAWSGALISTGLSAWIVYSTLKKPS